MHTRSAKPKRRTAVVVLGLVVAFGCVRKQDRGANRLDGVLFFGCHDVNRAGVCIMRAGEPAQVSFWVPTTDGSTTAVFVDGVRRPIRFEQIDGGVNFSLASSSTSSIVNVRRTDAKGVADWALKVQPRTLPAALLRAEKLRRKPDYRGARTLFYSFADDVDPWIRAFALGRVARLQRDLGRTDEARTLFHRSIRAASEANAVGMEIGDRNVLAYLETYAGRYADAEQALDPVDALKDSYPAAALLSQQYRAELASKVGDARRALRLTEGVMRVSRRLDRSYAWISAAGVRVLTLSSLQRVDEMRALLGDWLKRIPAAPACRRAHGVGEAGWMTLAVARNKHDLAAADRLLREAEALYRDECPQPRRLAYAQACLGLILLDRGDLRGAADLLAAAKSAPSAGMQLKKVRLYLEGELWLARNEADRALEVLERLTGMASKIQDHEMEWLATVARGRAQELAGRPEQAVLEYRAAERILDHTHLQAPLGAGRGGFLRRRGRSAQRLVALLLRMGRTVEAATAARHSRGRGLLTLAWTASLEAAPTVAKRNWYRALLAYQRARTAHSDVDEASTWGVSRQKKERQRRQRQQQEHQARDRLERALSSLGLWAVAPRKAWSVPAGTLLLSYHPTVDGWVAFAITSTKTDAMAIGPVDPSASREQLSRVLLNPFLGHIQSARRVQIAAADSLARVAFHTLPVNGRPLSWQIPVAYRVDVTDRDRTRVDAPASASVVAPQVGLPTSSREARQVSQMLQNVGWEVDVLIDEPVSRTRLVQSVSSTSTDWFHYAGHALMDGIDGWSSTLGSLEAPLLTVGDIVSLSRGPRYVVLSACESAAEAPKGVRFGLGQAFILAGADWVVAATTAVRDSDASIIADAFYRFLEQKAQLGHPRKIDPAAALSAAVVQVASTHPHVDWRSFVVLEP